MLPFSSIVDILHFLACLHLVVTAAQRIFALKLKIYGFVFISAGKKAPGAYVPGWRN